MSHGHAADRLSLPGDPPWLAEMRIQGERECDECGSPHGRYSPGGPGLYTTCRECTIAGACMICGGPLLDSGPCATGCPASRDARE